MKKTQDKCDTCGRAPKEGCSHVDCPHRRAQTAGPSDGLQPIGDGRYSSRDEEGGTCD